MQYERRGKFYTVKEGFSYLSFILPPLSFIMRSMYQETLLYLIPVIGLYQFLSLENFLKVLFFIHFLFAVYTAKLEVRSLKRRGYQEFDYHDYD